MSYVHIRVDGKLKKRVQKILKEMGLDMSTAIRMFFIKIVLVNGLPFDISLSKELMEKYQKKINE